MSNNTSPQELRPWASLTTKEQTRLRLDYQPVLDAEPLTCSMDSKMARFTAWLAVQGVSFTPDDLKRR